MHGLSSTEPKRCYSVTNPFFTGRSRPRSKAIHALAPHLAANAGMICPVRPQPLQRFPHRPQIKHPCGL